MDKVELREWLAGDVGAGDAAARSTALQQSEGLEGEALNGGCREKVCLCIPWVDGKVEFCHGAAGVMTPEHLGLRALKEENHRPFSARGNQLISGLRKSAPPC